ncbi:hypothetical protein ABB37_04980 [Leptomonas pyrrhocoris]|uniref:Uncharacterized protein n=1 Tax=Leptomonas pyrrhocoris TaxID=157538 RepID=A0A0M9G0X5_LEPPY|nr:hypothetical protein ABB37_04980 [Leptomonas pyrrhocoris]KPA79926.1 hypothetical protein ABB37_04980 [Leptomonas pyrrhocoris]|eukprot:XP_015658365.1 hypothetical protein ABB37_04980 [Leptomonas pyrrhocoris]
MLWSRCTRNTNRRIPKLDMPLREATRLARNVGCLGAPPAPSSSSSSVRGTPPLNEAALRDFHSVEPLRRCTGPDARKDVAFRHSSSFSDGEWWTLQTLQRHLFSDAHAPSEGASIAVSAACVNTIHVEGTVQALQCGHFAANVAGPSGHLKPGRRTACVVAPSHTAFPTVLLWLSMADSSSSSGCLLAVRCRLSPEVVEARWREQQQAKKSAEAVPGDGHEAGEAVVENESDANAEEKEASAEAKLRCVKAWVKASLLHRHVLVSGQLRMGEVYDGDLGKVVSVPIIDVPQDNLIGGVTALTFH